MRKDAFAALQALEILAPYLGQKSQEEWGELVAKVAGIDLARDSLNDGKTWAIVTNGNGEQRRITLAEAFGDEQKSA